MIRHKCGCTDVDRHLDDDVEIPIDPLGAGDGRGMGALKMQDNALLAPSTQYAKMQPPKELRSTIMWALEQKEAKKV